MGKDTQLRNSNGIAGIMFDELIALRDGQSTPQRTRSMASAVTAIATMKKLEMEYHRFISSCQSDENMNGPKPIQIG